MIRCLSRVLAYSYFEAGSSVGILLTEAIVTAITPVEQLDQ